MPRNPTQTDKPSTPEDPSWDGSPLTRYAWQKELPRRLARISPSFRTLCEYGYTVERSKVICANPTHRDHLYINNVAKQSFADPCDILTFNLYTHSRYGSQHDRARAAHVPCRGLGRSVGSGGGGRGQK
ncbi:hypothetical protein AB1Y20_019658 [Prymnesium parvum]|uniref:Uncharacterized protein n=1 Tax=Prymnesium parvum TaxID=97485 RepID=A0AB34JVK5_PRYPA